MKLRLLPALLLAAATAVPAQGHPVSGAEVMNLTKQFLAVAPHRAFGTPGHAAAEKFIRDHFAPEAAKGNFVADTFQANTPAAGNVTMTNYIAKFPGKKDGIIVIASHYETNWPLRNIDFVGANDGACTSAMLIALGNYYRTHPPQGYSVWLVFDDGEEAVENDLHTWTDSDSLFGTRHLAARWSMDGTNSRIKAFIVADMIGYKDLNIDKDANSTPWLEDILAKAAKNTNHSSYVFKMQTQVEDDHIPFKKRGVPVLDMIDIDYGPPTKDHPEGGYHHTTGDTIDKLSVNALQVSSDLFVEVVNLINQHG